MLLVPRQRVLFLLVVIAGAASICTGFVALAPNRLISGTPLLLWQTASAPILVAIGLLFAVLLALSLAPPRRSVGAITLVLAAALLLLLFVEAGDLAARLMAAAPKAQRVSLGPGFWIAIFALAMMLLDALQRLGAGATMRFILIALLCATLALFAEHGAFDQLSLLREYEARRASFEAALIRHLLLVVASTAIALLVGVPLGILAARRPGWSGAIFSTLNLLQTVPSVALFALLIMPLSALATAIPQLGRWGIGGIGAAPAIVALVLYALLPVVRNTEAGLRSIDAAVIESARGMGLTRGQILLQIEAPLGLPSFLAGLRIVLIQTIGLAAVAALIGAGGFGMFIFQGIGQYATDLVLLGALPIILLALAADFAVSLVAQSLERPRRA